MTKRRSSFPQRKPSPQAEYGIVIAAHGRRVTIFDAEGTKWSAVVRPRQRIVTGDRVSWRRIAAGQGIVESREPREGTVARPDENGRLRVIAANIDLVVVTYAPVPGITDIALDAYLVAVENLGLEALLVQNKSDQFDTAAAGRKERYTAAGYECLGVSAHTGAGLDELHDALKGRSSVLVGPSGVGKSSLINALIPSSVAVVGPLVHRGEHGAHTTSASHLHFLPSEGHVIDSPGIREFGLWKLPPLDMANGFPELRKLRACCRFRDCLHVKEPGCAVIDALQDGSLAVERYHSYLSLIEMYCG